METDRTGRFLLELPDAVRSGWQELTIDGRTAARPGRPFGFFEHGLTITARRTNVLPYTVWMPVLDTRNAVRLPSPALKETVITTPAIPGLELHLPANTVIRDPEGVSVREITITPVPVDRPPFPLPSGVEVPIYFTIQPGGSYVYVSGGWPTAGQPKGASLVYPNFTGAQPGTPVPFWNYEPEEKGWHVYGNGTVAAGGRQIVPDPAVVLYEFTGAMIGISTRSVPPIPPHPNGPDGEGADPVDLSSGLFVLNKTDLSLPDVIPIALTRTYRNEDNAVRPFGIGSTHPYDLWFGNQVIFQEADLVLPDGSTIHYTRISPGNGPDGAVYEHTETPTVFNGSRLHYNGGGWDLTLKDGTVLVFGIEAPLHTIRDRFGNALTIQRSGWGLDGRGNITKITAPHGRYIEFTYDASNRVSQAKDNLGRTVTYTYDAAGRLWKVTDPRGGITEYTYDPAHRLLTIKDPRNIVYLTNEYDISGRVIRQTQADGGEHEIGYTTSSGAIVQADLTNPRGYVRRVTFNAAGYVTSRTDAVGTPEEQTRTYTRNPVTLLIESITDALGRVTAFTYDAKANVTSVTRLNGTPDAATTTFTYDPSYNGVTSVTDPLSHTTTVTYDGLGRAVSVADALAQSSTFAYNAAGQLLSAANPLGHTTQFGYDVGDLVSVTTPLGHTEQRFFDTAGRLIQVTDASGARTRFEYDALNHVTKIVDPLAGETTFTYDGNGNLLTLTDAHGNTTAWTYDTLDRVATRTDPLLRQDTFTYDLNGNLATWTDRKGQVTTYGYDALDRQTFAGFGTTGTPPTYQSTIATTYDDGDRVTQVVDSAGGTIRADPRSAGPVDVGSHARRNGELHV